MDVLRFVLGEFLTPDEHLVSFDPLLRSSHRPTDLLLKGEGVKLRLIKVGPFVVHVLKLLPFTTFPESFLGD